MIADYLDHVEDFAVLPAVEPGSLRPLFPSAPPDEPEPLDAILGDVEALIEPNVTHWQHPGFFGWFATTASGAGMLGEFLTAGLGSNAMLWRTSPVATELEQVVVDWLRQALGLPEAFDGLLTDTASTSTLIALAAAREAAGLQVAAMGLAGRPDAAATGRLHLHRGEPLRREGVHDPRDRARQRPSHPTRRGLPHGRRRARGGDRGRSRRRSPAHRHRAHDRHHVDRRRSTRSPRSSTSPSANGCGCTSMPRTPARSRSSRSGAGRSRAGNAPIRSR